jgi:predicted ester cyclase
MQEDGQEHMMVTEGDMVAAYATFTGTNNELTWMMEVLPSNTR